MIKSKRRFFPFLVSILFIVCMLFSSCSIIVVKELEGTYKFESLSYTQDGISIDVTAGEPFMGAITLSEEYLTITLHPDGTTTLTSTDEEFADSGLTKGTWKKINAITIELIFEDGDPEICTCNGSQLIMFEDGIKITLVK